jgi:hypothetical protein
MVYRNAADLSVALAVPLALVDRLALKVKSAVVSLANAGTK